MVVMAAMRFLDSGVGGCRASSAPVTKQPAPSDAVAPKNCRLVRCSRNMRETPPDTLYGTGSRHSWFRLRSWRVQHQQVQPTLLIGRKATVKRDHLGSKGRRDQT